MQRFAARSGTVFPESAAEITPGWVTDVLSRCGVLGDSRVTEVAIEAIDTGMGIMGHYARVHLKGEGLSPDVPRTLFAKYSTGHESSLILSRREVLFYTTFAAEAQIRAPLCYFAGANDADTMVLVLMEDVTDGIQGDSSSGCTDEQAALVAQSLAQLHSQFWGFELTDKTVWLQRMNETLAPWFGGLVDASWPQFVHSVGGLPIWAERIAEASRPKLDALFSYAIKPPVTIVHGDCQPSNLKFGLPMSEVLFLDWQLTMISRPAHDLI